ncbi:BTB/POZ domain-containing protein At3g05675 [Linum perenne]
MQGDGSIGDRSTSDLVVRLRTDSGRDEWLYCHSTVLIEKCKYFADRLSESWPTLQIIDSRNCVDVFCLDSDIDHYVNLLRLLYVVADDPLECMSHGVGNVLGILQVAVKLGCGKLIPYCVQYLEAVPWEEADEEEILKIVPGIGSQAEAILSRLQPVDKSKVERIFLSAVQFATALPTLDLNHVKASAQDQIEYMLTEEDDDEPLLTSDDEIASVLRDSMKGLFSKFDNRLDALLQMPLQSISEANEMKLFDSHLSDLAWAFQILNKLEMMPEFVSHWVAASDKVLQIFEKLNLEDGILEASLKAIEVSSKVLEAISYGTVILPTRTRHHIVKIWLPFARETRPAADNASSNTENQKLKLDGEVWQSLESSLVSIVQGLPSEDQAEIIVEWLSNANIRYPDLREVFEMWCLRARMAKRRFGSKTGNPSNGVSDKVGMASDGMDDALS